MKILYIPLDERPCNYEIPQQIVKGNDAVELIVPPIELLGEKKISADIKKLWHFVEENISQVQGAVLSIDTLLFGGLIPSRIHHLSQEDVEWSINKIRNLKKLNPTLNLYAFECIMRSPQYDSSEEEPDYYETHGYALHRRAYLKDKENRDSLTDIEMKELKEIEIPENYLQDYEWRRDFNLNYNLEVARLVKEGILDFLVIPQDDSSEYGYTAIAQQKVVKYLSQHDLESKINIYPGADEVGTSLLARCLNDTKNRLTKVYAFYSSTLGPTIVPNYEDRPMHENLKYHLDVTQSMLVNSPEEADFILAINAPGKVMEEAFDQQNRDITYTSHRNLLYFVKEINRLIDKGYQVSICDSAFSNGGDLQLIKYLDEFELFDKLLAYAGWNTNSNTLGTVLGSSIYFFDQAYENRHEPIIYRLLEDGFYQAEVRQEIVNAYLPIHGLSYYNFKDKQALVEEEIAKLIQIRYNELKLAQVIKIETINVWMPWKRMFEVGLNLKIKS
ncbi:DUF4127 domain-containing protein [Erysipelothrix urinaevulpis]|uniref:DUF4127 family protein n=1 Tax=Erysipelothrix urinaevulpis TaxID=2683717 RepID=UPI00135A01DC|nr:DUF4127 family protein [Erysipelothrix urinaevulpis]